MAKTLYQSILKVDELNLQYFQSKLIEDIAASLLSKHIHKKDIKKDRCMILPIITNITIEFCVLEKLNGFNLKVKYVQLSWFYVCVFSLQCFKQGDSVGMCI